MKLELKWLWVLVLILCVVPIVSAADTCSFINITAGPPGTSCNITVNATFTGAAGTEANVTNIGTDTNAIYDFTIPAGATGSVPDSDQFLFLNGTRAMTGDLNMSSMNISRILYTDQLEAVIPSTPPTNTLRLYVEEVKGFSFFSFKDDTGMVRKLVRDSIIVAKNVRGTTIPAYRAVYATGSEDQVPTIDLAKADSMSTMPAIGLTIEAIADGDYGRVMQVGLLEDVNVDGYQEGDVMFVSASTAGLATNVSPTWPNIRQELGTILVTGDSGSFQVVSRSTINDGWTSHSGLLDLLNVTSHPQYVTWAALDANSSSYNATYDAYTNYNATYDAKPDSTYNSTYDALIGMTNYNASYVEYSNTSYALDSEVTAVNTSMKNYVDATNTSMKNYVDAGLPYVASTNTSLVLTSNGSYILGSNLSYMLVDGSRAMTGNLSLGSKYINNLISGMLGTDAVNKSYVDSVASSSYNATYDAYTNYNATYDAKPDSTYNATYDAKPDSTYNATYDALTDISNYNGSYVEHSNTSYFLTDGSRTMLGNITFTGNFYINDLTDPSQAQDAATKNYVDTEIAGIESSSYNATYDAYTNYNASYITSTFNSTYDAKPDSNYNASYITSTFNTTYDAKTNYNASYITSTFNSTYDVKAPATIYGYVTLMAGSAMMTTTNPSPMNQWETSTNKNNYISLNFTDGGSENAQWIVDFPADWNSSANVVFTPVWTASSGSGTVNWTISGKLFPNDAALDTVLAQVGYSLDTLIATGDMHVAPDSTGAAITSVATGGNTAIIKVARNSAGDTLSGTAQLIGLRVKYIRTLAG